MKNVLMLFWCLGVTYLTSCTDNAQITKLLNSKLKEDVILGAYKAGESEEKEFVPLLLKDAWDVRPSTNIQFKGITVYQAKMIALKKIFKKEPPIDITYQPDSSVIIFYIDYPKNDKTNWF